MRNETTILVTGATGYVGGRLVRDLEEAGHAVRCLVRDPGRFQGRGAERIEVVQGDVTQAESLPAALDGIETAYYLIHALGARSGFESVEQEGARNFAAAAARAGVKRIIYLGGLCDASKQLSAHMRSRVAVGKALRESGVPVLEFRASIVIGSGSLSFELVRALVRRLPVMIAPRWVSVKAQPIAISDVLAYLLAGLEWEARESAVYEIGGTDQMSYLELISAYAKTRGLRRSIVVVPVLTPRLSSLWLALVTPVYASVGRKLIESMTTESIVRDDAALRDFPIQPKGVVEAIEEARRKEDQEFAETSWTDALSTTGPRPNFGGLVYKNRLADVRTTEVALPPDRAFLPIQRIGGRTGWYYGRWLWELRGLLDRMVGGVGTRRGRRDPEDLRVGDAVDFWRVEQFDPPRQLMLRAEMKVPGRAWLQFQVEPTESGSRITQTALFDPLGWQGVAYWYSLYVVHQFVFSGMLRNIARAAAGTK